MADVGGCLVKFRSYASNPAFYSSAAEKYPVHTFQQDYIITFFDSSQDIFCAFDEKSYLILWVLWCIMEIISKGGARTPPLPQAEWLWPSLVIDIT